MDFFSWNTADTKESIANNLQDLVRVRTIYLLNPDGRKPIEEKSYSGYGEFDGVDAYVWLARNNLTDATLKSLNENSVRTLGIGLSIGSYFIDKDGKKWNIFHNFSKLDSELNYFPHSYETPMDYYNGLTPNELIRSGVLKEISFSSMVKFPLKFSFNPEAVYEGLPPSTVCKFHGFYYD